MLDNATSTVTSNIAHTHYTLSSREVASVSVTVDMNHTYSADVKIDLVAPDGTRETIRNGGGGSATYTGETFTNANATELDSFTRRVCKGDVVAGSGRYVSDRRSWNAGRMVTDSWIWRQYSDVRRTRAGIV